MSLPRRDLHCHVAPRRYLDALGRDVEGSGLASETVVRATARGWDYSVAEHHERLDVRGLDEAVVSLVPALVPQPSDPGAASDLCRAANEALLEWASKAPPERRVPLLATLPIQHPGVAVTELEWALGQGMAGAMIGTRGAGDAGIGGDAARDLWQLADERRCLVFIHPTQPRPDPRYTAFHLANLVGNPVEVALAAASLVFDGVLARHPNLRILLSHGGGSTLAMLGRWDQAVRIGRVKADGLNGSLPSDHASLLHFDTITHDHATLSRLATRFGLERLVVGTDAPFELGDPAPLATLEQAGFDRQAIDQVARINPARLLAGGN